MQYEIRDKSGKVAYKYSGPKTDFGGPWADPNQFDHVEVPDSPLGRKSFGMKELLDTLIAKGTIVKADLPAEGQRIVG